MEMAFENMHSVKRKKNKRNSYGILTRKVGESSSMKQSQKNIG